ncbi:MAG: oxidoreductase [Sphingomonas hengshuiensis]|uniref:Oxidoreductase n=1 Tax=Sphingomonas hengshuiensis TaxID=1609977 RepID=A0A2W5BAL6_9SPHN|nr:MAG: oxidoreductase [Sphingomonas hengshuiensis]
MAGGGEGAFIGAIHRKAAALDGDWRLVAGTFSSDGARNDRSGAALGLDPARVYPTVEALIAAERALPEGERIDALAIVTPNHLHAPMAIAALEAGIHVFCEKPMAMDSAEARAIAEAAQRGGAKFALAFTYSGYPLVEEARLRVNRGDLGKVRLVQVEYLQGWLSRPIDGEGNKQAAWRTDPAKAGMGGCLGDIGTHAFHLAEHVSGVRVESVCADLSIHVPGRRLDDDVGALLRFEGGARGMLKATQVAAGEENGLKIRVSGEHGTLEWAQMEPNTLTLRWLDRPVEVVRAGGPGLAPSTQALLRTPSGHPEGYIEAFANLYQGFAAQLHGRADRFVPGLADGLRTMAFIEAMIANAAGDDKWTPVSGRFAGEYR